MEPECTGVVFRPLRPLKLHVEVLNLPLFFRRWLSRIPVVVLYWVNYQMEHTVYNSSRFPCVHFKALLEDFKTR